MLITSPPLQDPLCPLFQASHSLFLLLTLSAFVEILYDHAHKHVEDEEGNQ